MNSRKYRGYPPHSSHTTNRESSGYKTSELTGSEIGDKKQTTVRFEASTVQEIEEMMESGLSFAEAVRRLTRKGLQAMKGGEQ